MTKVLAIPISEHQNLRHLRISCCGVRKAQRTAGFVSTQSNSAFSAANNDALQQMV